MEVIVVETGVGMGRRRRRRRRRVEIGRIEGFEVAEQRRRVRDDQIAVDGAEDVVVVEGVVGRRQQRRGVGGVASVAHVTL